jgi:hypothetical protein
MARWYATAGLCDLAVLARGLTPAGAEDDAATKAVEAAKA